MCVFISNQRWSIAEKKIVDSAAFTVPNFLKTIEELVTKVSSQSQAVSNLFHPGLYQDEVIGWEGERSAIDWWECCGGKFVDPGCSFRCCGAKVKDGHNMSCSEKSSNAKVIPADSLSLSGKTFFFVYSYSFILYGSLKKLCKSFFYDFTHNIDLL